MVEVRIFDNEGKKIGHKAYFCSKNVPKFEKNVRNFYVSGFIASEGRYHICAIFYSMYCVMLCFYVSSGLIYM